MGGESEDLVKLALFYTCEDLEIKDIDREIFTQDRKKFHFFLFQNQNLHFSKSLLFDRLLLMKFDDINPQFKNDGKTLVLTKKIENFDSILFEKEVEEKYQEYLAKVEYRIQCIFQTFQLFSDLYREKSQIYVFPSQILPRFNEFLNKESFRYSEISKIHDIIRRYDIFYWLNYYSRKDPLHLEDGKINYNGIVKILKVD